MDSRAPSPDFVRGSICDGYARVGGARRNSLSQPNKDYIEEIDFAGTTEAIRFTRKNVPQVHELCA